MGQKYQAVQWNGNKVVYDLYLVAVLILFLGVFVAVGLQTYPSGSTADPVVLMIRALGTASFAMLTGLLSIGPLARLSPRFRPFLYNRRHFGVLTFFVALAHAGLVTLWYHGGGPLNPLVSLLAGYGALGSVAELPFELFGLAALFVLLIMAATSHDFWLNNLSAPVWKALHMLVYPAYALLVGHVTLGALYTEKAIIYPVLTFGSFLTVAVLHVVSGVREWRADNGMERLQKKGWAPVCAPDDIPEDRAVIAPVSGKERVAVFRHKGMIYAISNVCRHQNGPLGEGRVVDGCVTCPWHGWQYRLEDGVSPPPFTEKVATYNVKLVDGLVMVDPRPNRPGTPVEPIRIATAGAV
ncbi:MAG: Rieske 2Fe-2S domain-containing protein [Pseudomonadota bacterium]